jgi:hypothetical protein
MSGTIKGMSGSGGEDKGGNTVGGVLKIMIEQCVDGFTIAPTRTSELANELILVRTDTTRSSVRLHRQFHSLSTHLLRQALLHLFPLLRLSIEQ